MRRAGNIRSIVVHSGVRRVDIHRGHWGLTSSRSERVLSHRSMATRVAPTESVGVAEGVEVGAGEGGAVALFERRAGQVAVAGEVVQPGGASAELQQPPCLLEAVASQVGGEVTDRSQPVDPAGWGRSWGDVVDQDRQAPRRHEPTRVRQGGLQVGRWCRVVELKTRSNPSGSRMASRSPAR